MRIKEDLMLRNIQGEWVVIPMGERLLEFNGIMKLNESGAFIWEQMKEGKPKEMIKKRMLEEYEVDEKTLDLKLDEFIDTLKEANILEE